MTTAYDNVIIGAYSSNNLTTGYQNVIIGSNSTTNASTSSSLPVDISNAIAIGYESYPSASNTIKLGNSNHTNINTSANLTLGEITIPNTDGSKNTFLITDGSGNLSFTNYEIKPHVTNVTYDGSDSIIIKFSRDISSIPSDISLSNFNLVYDGSSIAVLSASESNNNLVLNIGNIGGGGGGGGSGGSGESGGSSETTYGSPVTSLPTAVSLINHDGTAHARDRGDLSKIIDNDDATWSATTTSYSNSTYAPFIIKLDISSSLLGNLLSGVFIQSRFS